MLMQLFSALFKAGLPIAAISYGLVWWALRNNYLNVSKSVGDMEKDVKQRAKEQKKKKEKNHGDVVHNKWMAFGGGFYGVVGVFTYLVVELGEIRDFLAQFSGFGNLLSRLSVDLLVGLFIDSIMNFIVAVTWPVYWLGTVAGEYIWMWFIVAYLAYWAGARLALHRAGAADADLL